MSLHLSPDLMKLLNTRDPLLLLRSYLLCLNIGYPDLKHCQIEKQLLTPVFLLQEIRVGEVPVIRALFERVICLELPPRKMKVLFLILNNSRHFTDRLHHV